MTWIKKILFKLGIIKGYWDSEHLYFRLKKNRELNGKYKLVMDWNRGKITIVK